MSNFEEAIHKINKFVTFQGDDKEKYMHDLNTITKYIIKKLKQNDEVFNKLCKGDFFQGSYADNLKISKPDEYDIVIHLKLPQIDNANIEITADQNNPGYVNINIAEAIDKLPKHEQIWVKVRKHLLNSIDSNGFLDQKKISSWFQRMMTNVLNSFDTKSFFTNNNYTVSYSGSGPAHTLLVYTDNLKQKQISIDYVPGFYFDNSKWVSPRHWKRDIYCRTDWLAIPKPKKEAQPDKSPNISFISSYCDTERDIIKGKKQLKNIIRLLKKLRDKKDISRLKSYHIKTVFLWVDEEEDISFWNNPASDIFIKMFDKLIQYVEDRNLPFFWDNNQNMFGDLKRNQLQTMSDQLQASYNKIYAKIMEKPIPLSLYKEFLTDDEIDAMEDGKTLEEKLEEDQYGTLKTVATIASAGLLFSGLIYVGSRIFRSIGQNNRNNQI